MSRIGVVSAPRKSEENLCTRIEIKQEPCDHEESYEKSHAWRRADSPEVKPSSSALSAAETDNSSWEFLGNMKYEADESSDLAATEPPSGKQRDIVCPLCQQVYCTRTHYGYHTKREFITHLIKVHDYGHLRGHRLLTQCTGCKIKRERWTFIVGKGNYYKFSDVCSRCHERTYPPITNDRDGQQNRLINTQHRQGITSLWKNFVAHQEVKAELQESPEATAEIPTAAEEPRVQSAAATDSTTAEPPSNKKADGFVCHLCQQVYYKKTRYGYHTKEAFIVHIIKAHDYRHLRGYTVPAQCRSCNTEKGVGPS